MSCLRDRVPTEEQRLINQAGLLFLDSAVSVWKQQSKHFKLRKSCEYIFSGSLDNHSRSKTIASRSRSGWTRGGNVGKDGGNCEEAFNRQLESAKLADKSPSDLKSSKEEPKLVRQGPGMLVGTNSGIQGSMEILQNSCKDYQHLVKNENDHKCGTIDTGCQVMSIGSDTLAEYSQGLPEGMSVTLHPETHRFRSVHGTSTTKNAANIPTSLGGQGKHSEASSL